MNLFVGTSGFSYKEWKGPFYPEDLPASEMLAFYAARLNAVEINNTFYRMPSRKVLREWVDKVSPGFSFVLKVSRRITHQKRLKDAGEPMGYLLETSSALGEHRGPMLIQLPPYLKKDVERLRAFCGLLPEDFRGAFEFRHESWFGDDVYEVLREAGLALVIADTGDDVDPPVVPTAPYGYARLRREAYTGAQLAEWAGRLRAAGWDELYVFFKHEDAGAGPRLAARFREQAGA